jgi:hypothetical protein
MSSALAIACVTAVLRNLLENGLVERGVTGSVASDIVISTLPPDRITSGADERPQLNLFLYQITPNISLRPTSRLVSQGESRQSNPALALDLHYLLTAFGGQDFQIEILLGYAIQQLHQTSVLRRETILAALRSLAPEDGHEASPQAVALAGASLAEQLDQITLCPQFLSTEEMSKLWSAFQARYRPSIAYKASMALIEA